MPRTFEVTESVRHLEDKLGEIRTICRLHACPTGARENLVDLPSRLSQDAGFRADISDIVRSLQRMGLHLPDVLDILVLAVRGNSAPRHAGEHSEELSLLGGFLSNIGRWPGTDSAPILAEGEIPANIHKFSRPQSSSPQTPSQSASTYTSQSQALKAQTPSGPRSQSANPADNSAPPLPGNNSTSRSGLSVPLSGADEQRPSPVHLDDLPPNLFPAADIGRALARLERGNLELRAHLESIDQRISRMEPLLELSPTQSTVPPSEQASVELPSPNLPPPAETSLPNLPLPQASHSAVSEREKPTSADSPHRSVAIYEVPRSSPSVSSIPQPPPVVPRFSHFSRDPSPIREQEFAAGSASAVPSSVPAPASNPTTGTDSQSAATPISQSNVVHPISVAEPTPESEQAHQWTERSPNVDVPGNKPRWHSASPVESRRARQWPEPKSVLPSRQPEQTAAPSTIPDEGHLTHRPGPTASGLRAIPLPRGFFGTAPEADPTRDQPVVAEPDLVRQKPRRGLLALLFLLALVLAAGAYLYLSTRSPQGNPGSEPVSINSSPAPRTSALPSPANAFGTEGPLTSSPRQAQQPRALDPKKTRVLGTRSSLQPAETVEAAGSANGFRPAGTFVPASVMDGRLLSAPLPEQPRVPPNSGLRGMVILEANISSSGQVEDVNILGGNSALRSPAIAAVRSWRYKPYLLNGSPVEVRTIVRVDFSEHKSQPAQRSDPFPR